MNGRGMTLPPALSGLRLQASQLWRSRSRRERQALSAAAIVLAVVVVWLLAVQPAWRTLRQAPGELDQLDIQLQQMRRLAAESRELRGAPPVSGPQAAAALESASRALGGKAKLSLQGERATLTLTDVNADELRSWLAEARGGARARPVEAQLMRGASGGYNGSVVLQLPGPGPTP